MPFFPVDDQFAFCLKAVLAGNAPIGLWTRAGAECMRTASGGVVLREQITSLGTPAQAKKLVDVGLWHAHGHDCDRCPQPPKGGWVFHDWTDVGTLKTAEEIKTHREKARDRQRAHRNRQKSHVTNGVSHAVTDGVTNGVSHAPPIPSPDPSVVASVSQSPSRTRTNRLTDEDFEQIEQLLRCDRAHAVRVADLVLAKSTTEVLRPLRYVIAAIEKNPDEYRPTRGNPRTAEERCQVPGHSDFAGSCIQCASERKAGGER